MAGVRAAVAGAAKAGQEGEEGAEDGEEGGQASGRRWPRPRWRGRRRPRPRRTPGTACRRCPSWASWSTGSYRIVSQPPIVVPVRELAATYGMSPDETEHVIRDQFRAYRATLQDDRRQLLERFEIVDWARKVVGVGSVGTRAFIVLLQGRDARRPAVLAGQGGDRLGAGGITCPRAATASTASGSSQGQRLMQAASDIYLGWTKGLDVRRHYYWRQLRDMKGSAAGRGDAAVRAHLLRRHLRVDAGPGPRPVRGPGRHRRIPRRRATRSTNRSPTSPSATPTRTSRTTSSSPPRSDPGSSPSLRASEAPSRPDPG